MATVRDYHVAALHSEVEWGPGENYCISSAIRRPRLHVLDPVFLPRVQTYPTWDISHMSSTQILTLSHLFLDCPEEELSRMRQLILTTFEKEIHTEVTSKILIDELFFRYDKNNDHSISGYELKGLVTDYVMYSNIKELLKICHPSQWFNTADKDENGFLSKYEFSWSLGMINLKIFFLKS